MAILREEAIAILVAACRSGDMVQVQNAVAAHAITGEEVRSERAQALWAAILNGHLEVAEWLAVTFSLRGTDLRSHAGQCPAIHACAKGHLGMAQWFVDVFGIMAVDRADEDAARNTKRLVRHR